MNPLRLLQILRIARKYRLFDLQEERAARHRQPRGERLRLALETLGPVFVKFGQALSTRPDLLPPDIAQELSRLQDRVPPFPGEQAVAIIEKALGKPIKESFAEFDSMPMASASVAQVHAARLHSEPGSDTPGMEVVIKVLRPNVHENVARDIALLRALASFAERFVPNARRVRPQEVVTEYEKIITDELDLMREGANCTTLRRYWLGSEVIYHPIVLWDYTRPDILTMERIHGVSIRELDTLRERGADFQVLAERGVEIFFKQVFRDNFFHADMHPGNIFVDLETPAKPSYLAVDFGIVGSLSDADQRYLAENFLAFFNRDYKRVAELHLASGWVPSGTRVQDFESAIRTVCEPIFERPLKDISFGFFLLRLFQIARRFNYQVQPQLVLLQKTLFQVEGLGRQLYPELDLWKTAKPIMEEWMRKRMSPPALLAKAKFQLPLLIEALPQLSEQLLQRLEHGQIPAALDASGLESLRREIRFTGRRMAWMIAGATFWIGAALLFGYYTGGGHITPGWTATTAGLSIFGVGCWWQAIRARH